MKKLFTNEQQKYIRDNYLNLSYKEIANNLGFTEKQIKGWINHNCPKKNRTINDDYFDKLDTPLKNYFIGYIYADAWIVNDNNNHTYELGMELQSQDKYILEKLNEELGGQNIIYHTNPKDKIIDGVATRSGHEDKLRVYSKRLVESLVSHNIIQNKTQSNRFPMVSDEFFFDFLRGYIDGDGCYYRDGNKITISITCSSDAPLKYIQTKLLEYQIDSRVYQEKEKKYRLYIYNQNNVVRLINHLYYKDGLFCLQRKYEKIKHLIGFAA